MGYPAVVFAYDNLAARTTPTASSQHPHFSASNAVQRWPARRWRSRYGASSGFGNFEIDATNGTIYFDEGAGGLSATVSPGNYDADSLAAELQTEMLAAGGITYAVTFDANDAKFEVLGDANFDLICTDTTDAIWDIIGFDTDVDKAGTDTYAADHIRIHTRERLFFDFETAETPDIVAIVGHNFSAAAEVSLVLYSDAWVTELQRESVTLRDYMMMLAFNTPVSCRYAAIEIIDPENPDYYVSVGVAFVGNYFAPHYSFTMRRNYTIDDLSLSQRSAAGQSSSIQRGRQGVWNYSFDAIAPDDLDDVETILRAIGNNKAFFLVENIDAPIPAHYARYCSMISAQRSHIVSNWADYKHYWSLRIGIREEL